MIIKMYFIVVDILLNQSSFVSRITEQSNYNFMAHQHYHTFNHVFGISWLHAKLSFLTSCLKLKRQQLYAILHIRLILVSVWLVFPWKSLYNCSWNVSWQSLMLANHVFQSLLNLITKQPDQKTYQSCQEENIYCLVWRKVNLSRENTSFGCKYMKTMLKQK